MIVRAAFLLCRCYAVVLGRPGEVVLAFRLEGREGKGREAAAVAGGSGMTLGAGRSFVEG